MTLSTGKNTKGFTFIEVMIALIVLSSGIVLIYKSFFLCVDYLHNLTTRIYATHLIDSRIADISRSLLSSKDGTVDVGPLVEEIPINRRKVAYHFVVRLIPVGDIAGLYQLKVDLNWLDSRREMHQTRVAYLTR